MSKQKLDPTDISGLIDELDHSAFFRQPLPQGQAGKSVETLKPNQTHHGEKKPKHHSTKASSLQVPMEATDERTMKRTKERLMERTKIRHTFDILADQLLSLREIALEREKIFGSRVLIGDLVQEALDMFITKERNKE